MSKERGILFSAPMVRALLAGAKTQTRRAMKLREFGPSETRGYEWTFRDNRALWNDVSTELLMRKFCPYGVLGDRLWCRETWRSTPGISEDFTVHYRADEDEPDATGQWKPSIFMPRWASRITLEVTEVRVQRLQDISEEDAKAEGPLFAMDEEQTVLSPHLTAERNKGCVACRGEGRGIPELCHDSMRGKGRPFACWYATLWDSVNGAGSWASNPWVWAISFRRIAQ